MEVGLTELLRQLVELGFDATIINETFVSFRYQIPIGRFRGQIIEIAIEAPQFPLNPPPGPFIKPHLMPISGGGGVHPTGGVHALNRPTLDWQYWSRPFTNWNNSRKDARTYLAFLRTLFDFE